MKIVAPAMALIPALLLVACAQPRHAGTPSTDAGAPVAASHRYLCDSGNSVLATYPTTASAIVRYRGTTVTMHLAVSADGARYVGGGLVWWTKGSGPGSHGMLFEHEGGSTGGKRIESCTEQ